LESGGLLEILSPIRTAIEAIISVLLFFFFLENYNDIKQGEKGAWLSIVAYICLSAIKLFIGTIAGSQALLADGLNNSTDIIASIAVLIGLKISRRPPVQDE